MPSQGIFCIIEGIACNSAMTLESVFLSLIDLEERDGRGFLGNGSYESLPCFPPIPIEDLRLLAARSIVSRMSENDLPWGAPDPVDSPSEADDEDFDSMEMDGTQPEEDATEPSDNENEIADLRSQLEDSRNDLETERKLREKAEAQFIESSSRLADAESSRNAIIQKLTKLIIINSTFNAF